MNASTRQPCGFTPVNTLRITPSLPDASIPCSTSSTASPRLRVQPVVQHAEALDELREPVEPVRLRVRAETRPGSRRSSSRRVAGSDAELVEQLHMPEYAVDRCNHIVTSGVRLNIGDPMAHKHVDLTAAARAAFREKLRRKRRTVIDRRPLQSRHHSSERASDSETHAPTRRPSP